MQPNNTFSRVFRNKLYTLTKTAEGWECSNGFTYSSLSAAAKDICGYSVSGNAFWKPRKSRKKAEAKGAQASASAKIPAEAASQAGKLVAAAGANFEALERDLDRAKSALRVALEAQAKALIAKIERLK